MQDKAMLVRVTGRVQGVAFRAWTRDEARRRGLSGWVRNQADGSVTALLAGSEDGVSGMIEALWRGPPAASVSDVVTSETDPVDAPAGFEITA